MSADRRRFVRTALRGGLAPLPYPEECCEHNQPFFLIQGIVENPGGAGYICQVNHWEREVGVGKVKRATSKVHATLDEARTYLPTWRATYEPEWHIPTPWQPKQSKAEAAPPLAPQKRRPCSAQDCEGHGTFRLNRDTLAAYASLSFTGASNLPHVEGDIFINFSGKGEPYCCSECGMKIMRKMCASSLGSSRSRSLVIDVITALKTPEATPDGEVILLDDTDDRTATARKLRQPAPAVTPAADAAAGDGADGAEWTRHPIAQLLERVLAHGDDWLPENTLAYAVLKQTLRVILIGNGDGVGLGRKWSGDPSAELLKDFFLAFPSVFTKATINTLTGPGAIGLGSGGARHHNVALRAHLPFVPPMGTLKDYRADGRDGSILSLDASSAKMYVNVQSRFVDGIHLVLASMDYTEGGRTQAVALPGYLVDGVRQGVGLPGRIFNPTSTYASSDDFDEFLALDSRARWEKTTRPKIGQIDSDSTEPGDSEVRPGRLFPRRSCSAARRPRTSRAPSSRRRTSRAPSSRSRRDAWPRAS